MYGCILIFATILLNVYFINAYVLLQVRNKGLNHSDVDAVIHKTVSTDTAKRLTKNIARKHNMNDKPDMRSHHYKKELRDSDQDKGNIYVNLDVLKNNKKDNKTVILKDMEQVVGVILDKIGKWTATGFNYRSKDPLMVAKHINLRSKPSLMYEVNTNSILDVMSHVLASEQTSKLVDTLSKKAASVYKTHFN